VIESDTTITVVIVTASRNIDVVMLLVGMVAVVVVLLVVVDIFTHCRCMRNEYMQIVVMLLSSSSSLFVNGKTVVNANGRNARSYLRQLA
jgi:hypothetical protein